VDIIQSHPLQALVETGQDIFAAAIFAIRSGPHAIAGLGRYDELVAMSGEVGPEDRAESFLGRSGRWAIIISEIEMGDAQIESATADGAGIVETRVFTKIVPKTEREHRQIEAASAAAAILHGLIAVGMRLVVHIPGTSRFDRIYF